jgi:hypothetical protein
MVRGRYWASWAVVALGLWEAFAAFTLGYGTHIAMIINATTMGLLLVGFSLWQVLTLVEWPSWVTLGLGLWLLLSGAVFEEALPRAVANETVVGVLAVSFASLAITYARDVRDCRLGLPSCRLAAHKH